jgi:hypothetical protein
VVALSRRLVDSVVHSYAMCRRSGGRKRGAWQIEIAEESPYKLRALLEPGRATFGVTEIPGRLLMLVLQSVGLSQPSGGGVDFAPHIWSGHPRTDSIERDAVENSLSSYPAFRLGDLGHHTWSSYPGEPKSVLRAPVSDRREQSRWGTAGLRSRLHRHQSNSRRRWCREMVSWAIEWSASADRPIATPSIVFAVWARGQQKRI